MPDSVEVDLKEFAREALLVVTPESTIGAFVSEASNGDGVTSFRFETTMAGYPGWNWSVTIAHLPGDDPTVVESELLPADGALLAPDWVPWSERMEDYRAAQALAAEAGEAVEVDPDVVPPDEDDDDDDDDDFDLLHAGDLDGVDIDEIDEHIEIDDSAEAELELLPVQVDEGEKPESEADSGSENPPPVVRRRKRASKEQQNNQGD
jgi:hypothetical protein